MNRPGIIRDDFAGPGGWSHGLNLVGLREDYGIEFDATACETARLAGHQRWHVDVTSDEVRTHPWSRRWIWLYIASPPCQTFSMAGNGAGRAHLTSLRTAAELVAVDRMTPEGAIAAVSDEALDVRSVLVLEPLYVITRHMPRNVALEQVPPVLPIWEAYAYLLRDLGYSVWTGYVFSEQYGVPQTRKRAVLMASLDREITGPPVPTHSRYHSRNKAKMDDGVKPWVAMAEALQWGMTQRPSMTVTGGGTSTGGAEVFGNAARQTIRREAEEGRWALQGNQKPNGIDYQRRSGEFPAQTITGETGSFQWVPEAPNGGDTSWSENRPSPTIVGSFAPDVVAAPGYRKAGDGPRQSQPGSIRVSAQEAGILQSFPPDYPWQGKKGKQFEQVGNAVPPVMAAAIIASLLGLDIVNRKD
jgi:DNA (cytosine-5)-methyltransferase 1